MTVEAITPLREKLDKLAEKVASVRRVRVMGMPVPAEIQETLTEAVDLLAEIVARLE